eukprot:3821861-Rhodomonas_salina.1
MPSSQLSPAILSRVSPRPPPRSGPQFQVAILGAVLLEVVPFLLKKVSCMEEGNESDGVLGEVLPGVECRLRRGCWACATLASCPRVQC